MKIPRTLLLTILLLLPTMASAQNFPAKPIKLIVPFPAGGPNDIIARVIGQRMSELSGQPVQITVSVTSNASKHALNVAGHTKHL